MHGHHPDNHTLPDYGIHRHLHVLGRYGLGFMMILEEGTFGLGMASKGLGTGLLRCSLFHLHFLIFFHSD